MFTALPRSFYEPSARRVAAALLGHWLIRQTPAGMVGGVIVETEAYLKNDPACHAFRGETPRNKTMWGRPGLSYVYLIYGFYYCVNAVCQREGIAEAVLIRAVEPTFGMEEMKRLRPVPDDRNLTSGPGKLCKAMNIQRTEDGLDLTDPASALFVAANPDVKKARRQLGPLIKTSRIGINLAVDWPLRFYLDGSPWISKRARKVI